MDLYSRHLNMIEDLEQRITDSHTGNFLLLKLTPLILFLIKYSYRFIIVRGPCGRPILFPIYLSILKNFSSDTSYISPQQRKKFISD